MCYKCVITEFAGFTANLQNEGMTGFAGLIAILEVIGFSGLTVVAGITHFVCIMLLGVSCDSVPLTDGSSQFYCRCAMPWDYSPLQMQLSVHKSDTRLWKRSFSWCLESYSRQLDGNFIIQRLSSQQENDAYWRWDMAGAISAKLRPG